MEKLLPEELVSYENLIARNDISLISDEVSSREEFQDAFMKYLMLSRRDRRFSDYYSVKLFGSNVPEMFFSMNYRFKLDTIIPMQETLFFSEPDLYYNKKAFDEGKINLCFVIGYSGSGKSVLTKEYEGSNIEKVALDDLVCPKDHFTLDQLKETGELMYSFFAGTGAKYYISREERDVFADHSAVFVAFIMYAMQYATTHKDKKYILEGIWTYLFFEDPSVFDNYAVYMKGTSLMKSKFRRLKRESYNSPKDTWYRLIDFGIYAGDSAAHDSNVDKWRRHFERERTTIIKPEANYFTILRENIMAQINTINDCFAHGDRDGINSIMQRAIESTSIDKTEKSLIIEECKKALADL